MYFLSLFTRRILLMVALAIPLSTYAQNENELVTFLNAGERDASKLMNAYLNPMIEGLSYGFNGGWYTTAKAHKTLGFDFGVSVNAVFIPSSKNYFDPAELGLETAQLIDPAGGKAPTIVGPDVDTEYESNIDADGDGVIDQTINFSGPRGLDFKENLKISGVLAPTAQLGIGIYKNTDLKIRWMPEIDAGDSKVKLIGFGVMHDIKQHIPGIKLLPFDLSMLVAFTKIQGTTNLEGEIERPAGNTRPQEIDYKMNAWLIQALISKKIAIVTFYGGIGYNAIKTTSDITGDYMIYDDTSAANQDIIFTDPVSMSFKNKSFRLTGGVRLNLGPIYLKGDYTLQEYSTLSIGLGATVR